jgi:hypothetical protein
MNYGFGQQPTDNTEEANEVKTTAQSTSAEPTEDTTKVVIEIYNCRLQFPIIAVTWAEIKY